MSLGQRFSLIPITSQVSGPEIPINRMLLKSLAGILHVVGFIAIVSVLGALSPKHSAEYVFTEFSNTSGWTNDGASWLVGLLSTVYPFLGYVLYKVSG